MAHLEFLNVGVAGLAAAVPHNIIKNYNISLNFKNLKLAFFQ